MKNDLILEIGTEEIPALFLQESAGNLNRTIKEQFEKSSLSFGEVETYYTPRRLTLRVFDLSPKQKDQVTENFGPPKRIAFDEKGKPTSAAVGFAKSQGVDVKQLEIAKRDNGEFLVVRKKITGQKTDKVLKDLLPGIISSISFRKSMRWGYGKTTFARPVRWIMCIYGGKKLSFGLEGLSSDTKSYGHRFSSPKPFSPKSWNDYIAQLRKRDILLDQSERKKFIEKNIDKLAKKLGGSVASDDELLETVTNLVEYPVVLHGSFEKKFLNLPEEVLISVMKNHQKYFPVFSKSKKLLPYFIFVSGTQVKDSKVVVRGNERVIRARFTDAEFFYNEDSSEPLEAKLDGLKTMVFLSQIGSYYEKTKRLEKLAGQITKLSGEKSLEKNLKKAALLSKCDLTTQMVFELPELQGIMGKYYSLHQGVKKSIALAIEEHYMPTGRDASLPTTELGSLLSIVDKTDNICSCFIADLKPTGSADPYALRRQAIGIIQIVISNNLDFELSNLTGFTLNLIKPKNRSNKDINNEILKFFSERFKNLLLEEGYSNNVIESVISNGIGNIVDSYNKIKALEKFKKQKDFDELAIAFKRVVNIAKDKPKAKLNTKLFKDRSEMNLYKTFNDIKKKTEKYFDGKGTTVEGDYLKALSSIKTLKKPVDNFFDSVLVMDEDKKLRDNRLALLSEIKDLFFQVSDFSKI